MKAIRKLSLDAELDERELGEFLAFWSHAMARECHRHPIWQSSFIAALRDSGTPALTRFQLASVWAVNMIPGSYSFPGYVAALAARAELDGVRHGLLENAWDESGGVHHVSRSHFWLAVRLGRLLGLSDADIESIEPLPQAQAYMQEHHRLCASADFEFALGMICLIEEFTTPEFSILFRALQDSCTQGLEMPASEFVLRGGAEYFTANIADDERHRQAMPRLVAAKIRARAAALRTDSLPATLSNVIAGVRHSIELRQQFFENIHQYVMRGGTYRCLCRS